MSRVFIKIFDRVACEIALWRFLKIFKVMFTFHDFCTQKTNKTAKTVTDTLNGCNILKKFLRPLEYILRFPSKLLFKVYFGDY